MSNSDYIAIYGAALSTVLLLYQVLSEIVKNNRRIKVTSRLDNIVTPKHRTVKMLCINAVNVRHRPITITHAGLIMRNNSKLNTKLVTEAGEIPLPKLLNDGDNVTVYLDINIVLDWIEKQKYYFKSVYVCDAEGKCYTAKLPKDLVNRIKLSDNRQ